MGNFCKSNRQFKNYETMVFQKSSSVFIKLLFFQQQSTNTHFLWMFDYQHNILKLEMNFKDSTSILRFNIVVN